MEKENGSNISDTGSFLDPIKAALSRMKEGEVISPAAFRERAEALLESRFGEQSSSVHSGFAYGTVGIQADHSHYFNGFALLKPMRHGVAVSIRAVETNTARIVAEGSQEEIEIELGGAESGSDDIATGVLRQLMDVSRTGRESGYEIAIVSTVPEALESSFLASMGVAASCALDEVLRRSLETADRAKLVKQAIESVLPYPISIAYMVAAATETTDEFILVDTQTLEYLPLGVGDSPGPGWALVSTSSSDAIHRRASRNQWSDEILSKLQVKQFSDLRSLRDLEHRDLEKAAQMLPRKMRPGLRYLVSENRRVQRLVAAIRNQDWQLMGALLLMSHATRRNDWSITSHLQNFIVDEAERFSIEGVYGATQTGEGSFVLIAGQPVGLPAFLDHIRSNWPPQAVGSPEIFII